jgi:hypothetical protein
MKICIASPHIFHEFIHFLSEVHIIKFFIQLERGQISKRAILVRIQKWNLRGLIKGLIQKDNYNIV